ncbi:MAG TPA: hypothetical protein PK018_11310 [Candidatus Competibacter sp.]|nr:hypothetical protein [Candidatus Competibacter sp.]
MKPQHLRDRPSFELAWRFLVKHLYRFRIAIGHNQIAATIHIHIVHNYGKCSPGKG